MKIGIITFQDSYNYGATLQAYALWSYISSRGHECEIIRLYRPTFKVYKRSHNFIPLRVRETKQNLIKKILRLVLNLNRKKQVSCLYSNRFKDFNTLMKFSKPYFSVDDLYNNPPIYDLYITGSDQVWNPTFGYCMEPYFLTFSSDDKVRISYASSIGIDHLYDNEQELYKKWLLRYDAISVREKTAQEMLEQILQRTVEKVSDPCVLLSCEQWQEMALSPKIKEKYILLYNVGQRSIELEDFAHRISEESGMKLVYLCRQNILSFDGIIDTDAGPKEFLGYINSATIVISNSFHASLFAIILGVKNFFTYIPRNSKRGSRIQNLVEDYDMEDHILDPNLTQSYSQLEGKIINLEDIKQKTNSFQKKSQQFLNDYL